MVTAEGSYPFRLVLGTANGIPSLCNAALRAFTHPFQLNTIAFLKRPTTNGQHRYQKKHHEGQ